MHGLDIESGSTALFLEQDRYCFSNHSYYSATDNLNLSVIRFHENTFGIGKSSFYTAVYSRSPFSFGSAIFDIAESPQNPLIPPTIFPVFWAGAGIPLGDATLSCHSAIAYDSLWIKPAQSITPFLDMEIHTFQSVFFSLEHPTLTLLGGKITANADMTLFRTYYKGSASGNAHFILVRNENGGLLIFDGMTTAHFNLSLGWGFISKYKFISDSVFQGAGAWYQHSIKKESWEAIFFVAGGIIKAQNFNSSLEVTEFGQNPKIYITKIPENPAWAIVLRPTVKWTANQNIRLSLSRIFPIIKPWDIETITNSELTESHNTTLKTTSRNLDFHTILFAGMEIGITVRY